MKKYLTEIYHNGKVYGHYVLADDWKEAEKICAANERVVGILEEEIELWEN